MFSLRYGLDSLLLFERVSGPAISECQAPRGQPLADLKAAVAQALNEPLEFPSLAMALVPGDRVVLAVEADVPQVAELMDAVVRHLAHCGIEPADVTVLLARSDADAAARIAAALAHHGTPGPAVAVHDPADRGNLAYLAAGRDGEPVYLNRQLCDADVVLPIGCARLEATPTKTSLDSGLYPAFADTKAQQQAGGEAAPAKRGKAREKAQEKSQDDAPPNVYWMLGVQCVLLVVPGPGDSVLSVLAGDPITVARHGRRLCDEAWSFRLPERASLVVAAVEGGASQQTWSHIARAVTAAAEAVADDGTIAICCDLDAGPGPALQALAQSEDRSAALRRIRKQHLPDADIASQFAKVLERARIYLLSRLDESVVEELGLAPVASGDEVVRLAGRHDSCLLLANAQHAVATVEGD